MNESNVPETQIEAIRFFADLDNCHNFLVSMRWPDGKVTCPHCGSDKVGAFGGQRKVSNCKSCKKQFTVKVGTIFEDSPLKLDKWLPAFWLITNAKNGISSCELARALGVTQKTAWHMGHRIRKAVQIGSFAKMQGIVEADETYIGAKARNMHYGKRKVQGTGGIGKTAVQGLLERHSASGKSRVIAKVIPHTKKSVVQGNVREYVLKGSGVMTDALRSYSGLQDAYTHQVIDHAEKYVDGNVHTNGLENFWTLLKRSIKGTYVHCAPFHLHRYLDEQAYRFNERHENDATRFVKALRTVTNRRLTYQKLIGKRA
jgi:transposase-like protein